MENKTKSKILSIALISLLSVIIIVVAISIVFKYIIVESVEQEADKDLRKVPVDEMIQVNVLNGCGAPGIASKVREYLRVRGIDVVDIGNYSSKADFSFIIDRIGDTSASKKVASAMGIPDSIIKLEIDSGMFLKSSIILGKDYQKLKPFIK